MGGSATATPTPSPQNEVNVVQLVGTPLKKSVLTGVQQTTHALITVKTSKDTGEKMRQPVEICLVLDRSGSMAGAKLNNSKKAIMQVIASLHSDDRIHFITYDDTVNTVFQNESTKHSKALTKKVAEIKDGGSTNIGGALQSAYKILQGSEFKGLRRVFLFSDGENNAGPLRTTAEFVKLVKEAHNQHAINTSAFGLGEGFNEELMTAIAESGKGEYFFIENDDQIGRIINEAMRFFTTTCGKEVVLKLQGVNGSVVTKVYGHTPGLAKLGYLYFEDEKTVLLEATISLSDAVKDVETPIINYTLEYLPVAGSDAAPRRVSGSVTVVPTTDAAVVAKCEEDASTFMEITAHTAAEEEEKAMKLLEQGKLEEAKKVAQSNNEYYNMRYAACSARLPEERASVCQKQALDMAAVSDMCEKQDVKLAKKKMDFNCRQKKGGWKNFQMI